MTAMTGFCGGKLRYPNTDGMTTQLNEYLYTVMSVFSAMRYCLGDPTDYKDLWIALGFMPFGLFFDFMDGKVARWRKRSSLMGQELDSLADLVREKCALRDLQAPS